MKYFGLLLLFSQFAHAQINLDHPVRVSIADEVYTAGNDQNIYYFLPAQLCRISDVNQQYVGARLIAEFSVGICPQEIEGVKKLFASTGILNPDVRILRGINAVATKMQLDSMFPSYDPQIEVLGDAGNLMGPVIYRVSLYSGFHHHSQDRAWNAMSLLFAEDSLDAFIQVEYQFSSIFGGTLTSSSSAVAVYIARQYAKGSVFTAKPKTN